MPYTSYYRNTELFVEAAILKVKYLAYVPKYWWKGSSQELHLYARKKKKIKNSQSIKYHISLMVYPSKKIHRPKNKKIKDFYWENSI